MLKLLAQGCRCLFRPEGGRAFAAQTVVTNAALMAVGLIGSIVVARAIGAQGRGELAAAMLWPTVLTYFGSFGLFPATVYFSALPEAKPERIFANAAWLAIPQSAVVMSIGYFTMPWLLARQSPEVVRLSQLFLAVIPISLVTQYALSIMQGKLRISIYNFLRLIIPFGYVVGVLILLPMGLISVERVLWLNLGLNVGTMLATLGALFATVAAPSLRFDFQLAGEMLRYGVKVWFGDLSQGVNMRLDQALIAAWLPAAQLGHYVIAVSVAGLTNVLSNAVRMVLTPTVTRQLCELTRVDQLRRAFNSYWLLSLLVAAGLALASPLLIPALFGREFAAAVWLAQVLIAASLFANARNVLGGGFQGMGKPWIVSWSEMLGLGLTVAFLMLLLPIFGVIGAAVSSLLVNVFQLAILVASLRRDHRVGFWSLFRIDFEQLAAVRQRLTDFLQARPAN
jgi:O-antigen/teichoic acid export membrane protein